MNKAPVKYELTLSELIEKFNVNKKTKDLKEFYFQGENYKSLCAGYINSDGFLELRTFAEKEGVISEVVWHRTALNLTVRSFAQKYRIIESLNELV